MLFKLNTVVNKYNINDDMGKEVSELAPIRWKVFQCLSIYAENEGPGALKQVSFVDLVNSPNSYSKIWAVDLTNIHCASSLSSFVKQVEPFLISDEEFEDFVSRHRKSVPNLIVPENNDAMRNSYLILDEYMR